MKLEIKISIVGYFTVPSVANYIVHAGGGNTLLYKVTSLTSNSSRSVLNSASSGAGMVADAFGNGRSNVSGSMASNSVSQDYFNEGGNSKSNGFMHNKISGKS